jgi:hypothetical protein
VIVTPWYQAPRAFLDGVFAARLWVRRRLEGVGAGPSDAPPEAAGEAAGEAATVPPPVSPAPAPEAAATPVDITQQIVAVAVASVSSAPEPRREFGRRRGRLIKLVVLRGRARPLVSAGDVRDCGRRVAA